MAGSPTLVVTLGGHRIGTLRRVRNGARFSYAPELAQASGDYPQAALRHEPPALQRIEHLRR